MFGSDGKIQYVYLLFLGQKMPRGWVLQAILATTTTRLVKVAEANFLSGFGTCGESPRHALQRAESPSDGPKQINTFSWQKSWREYEPGSSDILSNRNRRGVHLWRPG